MNPAGRDMKKDVRKQIRRELRGPAEVYSLMTSENPAEESFRKMDKACEKLMKGRWIGRKTEAHEAYIEREDHTKLRVLIVTKKDHKHDVNERDTGVLWIHGGGYALGMPEMDFKFADMFCENDDAVLIMPDYRHSTEAPYPAALDDCMLALEWMKEHADILGINPDQLFVGGESAGGGLTCAVTLRARDEGKISIAFCMPLYPMIDDTDTPSSCDNHLPVWNTAYNHLGWKMYRGNLDKPNAYFSPSRAVDYHDLPPAFTLVSDIEPFHDEVKTYFDNLYQAGVPVMYREFRGCFHAFDMTAPFTHAGKKAADLERNVFHYAQAHFIKTQPVEGENKKTHPAAPEEEMMRSLKSAIDAHEAVLKRKNQQEKKEDVFDNLQKIIKDDTAESLHSIEQMMDKLR